MAASVSARHAFDTLKLHLGYGVTSQRTPEGGDEIVMHLHLGAGLAGVWIGTLTPGQAYELGRDLLLHVDHLAGSERADRELRDAARARRHRDLRKRPR